MPAKQPPSKVFPALKASLPRMDGKVVAITGCTSGTGLILAKTCAELGAEVVMLNRPSKRADDALAQLKSEFPNASVSLVACDLMRFESVREASAQLQDRLGDKGLDVLCNNAAIMATKDEATVDGYDKQMQTNHLSHFLLTAELFPLLEKAASKNGEARVVNHSSIARLSPPEPLEQKYFGKNSGKLGGDDTGCMPTSGPRWKRYQQTKLANVVFTYALDDRLKAAQSKVKTLVAHPGVSFTNLFGSSSNDGGVNCLTNFITNSVAQSGEDGTAGILTCCCAEDVASRQFYGPVENSGIKGPAVLMKEDGKLADQSARDLLWAESQKATGTNFNL